MKTKKIILSTGEIKELTLEETIDQFMNLYKLSKFYKAINTFGEDIVKQESLIGIMNAYKHYNYLENIKFSTYATNSIWNRIKNLFKYEYTQKRAAEKNAISTETVIMQGTNHSVTLGETIEDEFGNIERIIIKKDICEKLKLATRDIKDMYKDVLELYFFEGLSYREIAERIGNITRQGVQHRVKFIAKTLKKNLEDMGIDKSSLNDF